MSQPRKLGSGRYASVVPGPLLTTDKEPLPPDEPPPLTPEQAHLIANMQRRWAAREVQRIERERNLRTAIAAAHDREAAYQRQHRTP